MSNVKVLVGAFNPKKALVGAFSVIVKTDGLFAALKFTNTTFASLEPRGRCWVFRFGWRDGNFTISHPGTDTGPSTTGVSFQIILNVAQSEINT